MPAYFNRFLLIRQWMPILACLLPAIHSGAQPRADSLILIRTLPVSALFATTDHLGQVYVLTTGNALEKYDPEGRRLARYSNNRLGLATYVDVTNPLKLVVWYAEFRTVVFLDRSLTELGSLSLDAVGFSMVRSVATSFDGNLWVYDEASFRLKKITPEGLPLFESPALNQLAATAPTADALREIGNQVYLLDRQQGVFVFDQYAALLTNWTERPQRDFYVAAGRRYYLNSSELRIYDAGASVEMTLALPADATEKSGFQLAEQKLVVWDEHSVRIFRTP